MDERSPLHPITTADDEPVVAQTLADDHAAAAAALADVSAAATPGTPLEVEAKDEKDADSASTASFDADETTKFYAALDDISLIEPESSDNDWQGIVDAVGSKTTEEVLKFAKAEYARMQEDPLIAQLLEQDDIAEWWSAAEDEQFEAALAQARATPPKKCSNSSLFSPNSSTLPAKLRLESRSA